MATDLTWNVVRFSCTSSDTTDYKFEFENFRLKTTRKFTLDGMQDLPQNEPKTSVSEFYQNIKKHNKFVHFIHIYFSLLVCSQKIRTP